MGAYSKGGSDKRFQPLGNYTPSGYSYSKAETGNKYQPKGDYAPDGNYGAKNTASKAQSGWWKCGDTGIMQQWNSNNWRVGQSLDFKFPIPFPNVVFVVMVTDKDDWQPMGTTNRTKTGFTLTGNNNVLN
ncbi:gp53-like domain-containing protein, partial [Proteus columbae]|uniref:gp53-like domain-containing protein n=1 Tax=Proteus columbae TaxID=1987580 RepID=UPI003D7F5B39|nr:hypothetical protein [Proteus columbae]